MLLFSQRLILFIRKRVCLLSNVTCTYFKDCRYLCKYFNAISHSIIYKNVSRSCRDYSTRLLTREFFSYFEAASLQDYSMQQGMTCLVGHNLTSHLSVKVKVGHMCVEWWEKWRWGICVLNGERNEGGAYVCWMVREMKVGHMCVEWWEKWRWGICVLNGERPGLLHWFTHVLHAHKTVCIPILSYIC